MCNLTSLVSGLLMAHYYCICVVLLQVGYPNVGKSSTVNTLLEVKKVPVSATPGRTKHFQVFVDCRDLLLSQFTLY